MRGIPQGVPPLAVDVDEEVAGDAEGEEVDRGPAHDLVGAEMNREDGVNQRQRGAAPIAASSPKAHDPDFWAARIPKNAPASIIPSRAMFTTPGAREDPADRRERRRRRVAQHRRRSSADHGDDVELPDARLEREQASSRGSIATAPPPEPPHAPRHRPDACGDAEGNRARPARAHRRVSGGRTSQKPSSETPMPPIAIERA